MRRGRLRLLAAEAALRRPPPRLVHELVNNAQPRWPTLLGATRRQHYRPQKKTSDKQLPLLHSLSAAQPAPKPFLSWQVPSPGVQ